MDAFIAGAWRSPSRAEVLAGGTWRRVSRAEGYIGGQWRTIVTFVPPLSLSVTPEVYGFRNSAKPTAGTVTSSIATATPIGGAAPFTYAWTIGSGITASSPSSASTSFSAYLPADTIRNATAQVVCTDSLGSQANGSCAVELSNMSDFSGG